MGSGKITPTYIGDVIIKTPFGKIDTRSYGLIKVKRVAFGHSTSEADTGFDLPEKALLFDIFLDVQTADSGKTINVGTKSSESGGDADGFIKGASVGSTGLVIPSVTVTSGSSETYFSATTYGALLADFEAGSDNAGDVGTFYKHPYPTDSNTAKSLTYTCSAGTSKAAGYIYLVYLELE